MNVEAATIVKDLVLIGGGHSHVEVLKRFAMKPMPGVRLTLIARDVHTPYSGMLPGYVAGHYDFDQAHVDLRPLSRFAAARLYHDQAIGIDTRNKQVICATRPPVDYDVLSINIGSRPDVAGIPGAVDHTTAVKPINRFVERWQQLVARVLEQPGPHRIAVVGAGAAGVEILLSVQFRLRQLLDQRQRTAEQLEFHLLSKSARVLPAFPVGVSERFDRVLSARGVHVYRSSEVVEASAKGLLLSDGRCIACDEVLWVTGASAPSWLRDAELALDKQGFIAVRDTLQSTSHPDIFAAGDIAHVLGHPRPKAGVFAVRQGVPLSANLRRALLGRTPKSFVPQTKVLALISTGDRYVIANKGPWHAQGKALWRWKDRIDRRWMARYCQLPVMPEDDKALLDPRLTDRATAGEISAMAMRCGGCAAKVGPGLLERALSQLEPVSRSDVLIGLHEPDDAAVVAVAAGKVLVSSVDYFRAFIDDPYLFGQIAANHSLSDIFAMGAEAQSALAIATVPYGIEVKVEQTLHQLMAGAMKVLNEANTALTGGHTSEGAELGLGFAVNGLVARERILRKGGMAVGEVLIVTKALGTGTLFAADMRRQAKGRWIEDALASMLQSNADAARCLYQHGASACTDVTGFGLLGHLVEMIRPSAVDVEIELGALPLMSGALDTLAMGIVSSLQPANLRLRSALCNVAAVVSDPRYPILFDPQTSGGLLASVPAFRAEACVQALRALGYSQAALIGRVRAQSGQLAPVTVLAAGT